MLLLLRLLHGDEAEQMPTFRDRYYPPLINTSRCCDQPICTECFVQIKRAEPTISNLNVRIYRSKSADFSV